LIDLLISLFIPVRRFRCRLIACAWEGNLRERRHSLPGRGGQEGGGRLHLLEPSRMGRLGPSSEKPQ